MTERACWYQSGGLSGLSLPVDFGLDSRCHGTVYYGLVGLVLGCILGGGGVRRIGVDRGLCVSAVCVRPSLPW